MFFQLFRFIKEKPQAVFKPDLSRSCSETICADMTTFFMPERFCQEVRKSLQEPVSRRKSVPVVIVFHPVQVDIQKAGLFSFAEKAFLFDFTPLEEICQARKTGQRIIICSPQDALLMQNAVDHSVHPVGSRFVSFNVDAFVYIPDISEPDTWFRISTQ